MRIAKPGHKADAPKKSHRYVDAAVDGIRKKENERVAIGERMELVISGEQNAREVRTLVKLAEPRIELI